jgi:hydrogenase-4 component B
MSLTLLCIGLLLSAGILSALLSGARRLAHAIGAGGAAVGSGLGLVTAIGSLLLGTRAHTFIPWSGYGTASFVLDPLAALFLVPIFLLSGLAALYGSSYLLPHRESRRLGWHWLCFNVLVASMVVAVTAADVLVFLVAWETMALASFFLVMFDADRPSVREAGWVYLVATHLGSLVVAVVLLVLAHGADSLEFEAIARTPLAPGFAGLLFVLAVVGFGTKAGFVPLHVWLPEAHPAAPSHVSALMSGVMIKTGIYALIRTMGVLGTPALWWGLVLVGVGVVSGVLGVLLALAQHDLKRLLAYHSVENIGIITIGIGLGVVGATQGHPGLAVLGYAGALLHVVNHALFKGLLFFGAGSVDRAIHTREIDRMGGLLRRMPWTGVTFLVGAVAICGLPPLNGFVSEWLVYLGAFGAGASRGAAVAAPAVAGLAALALIGGLASACFAKAFGIVFLGQARVERAEPGRDPGWLMRGPMVVLALSCAGVGLGAPAIVPLLARPVAQASGLPIVAIERHLAVATASLGTVVAIILVCLGVLAFLALVRALILSRREVRASVTWDCGYAAPTPHMQYTASSFAQPLLRALSPLVRTRKTSVELSGYFPRTASFSTETPDVGRERIFGPVFTAIVRALGRVRVLQHGDVHIYVLYVAITLVALLVWKL